ncbi:MAG: 1-deoxy-D-xylulose-5-phosphate synthase [Victivallales bacterium]|nr:1-deoxy-D-xylulose-5-phosphate synthase [Victivallales bacterium]
MSFTLDQLTSETRLRDLSLDELRELAADIRREILETVARQGGHLASNLGTVELELALHTVFDFHKDRLFFDTGHQCYTHKLLTGRRQTFQKLRATDGCSGFPVRAESSEDAFGAGHSGTAISAALGYASALDRQGDDGHVIALVGDGALGCGSSLEGLNNLSVTTKRFLLILNDNKMSIAPNVGAISRFLNHVISARSYNFIKGACSDFIRGIPLVGPHLREFATRLDLAVKSLFLRGRMFSDLGLRYIGPVDGHDLDSLITILNRLKNLRGPILLHTFTTKGRGYPLAEQNPSFFHGTGPFDLATGKSTKASPAVTFSQTFGDIVCEARQKDSRILAITAGMVDGTGLKRFAKEYPEGFFDVGIAEGHGSCFAAGLAAAGMRPVVAIYASFIQRAFDYVFHDACLQNLPVVFCLDRAGAGVDGPTHHGILDFAFWQALPNLAVLQPSDAEELRQMFQLALQREHPVVLRYPAGDASNVVPNHAPLEWGKAEVLREGTRVALWAVGRECVTACKVADCLADAGISVTVVNARFTRPFDEALMRRQASSGMLLVTLEDHVVDGGFGAFASAQLSLPILKFGWRELPSWGSVAASREKQGLLPEQIAHSIQEALHG